MRSTPSASRPLLPQSRALGRFILQCKLHSASAAEAAAVVCLMSSPRGARLQLNMSRRPRQQAGARVRRRRHLLSYGMHEAQFLYVYGARGKQRGRDGLPESGIQSLRIWKKFSEMQAQETSLSPPCWYFPTVRNRAHGGNTYFVAHGYVTEIHYKVF